MNPLLLLVYEADAAFTRTQRRELYIRLDITNKPDMSVTSNVADALFSKLIYFKEKELNSHVGKNGDR